MSPSSLATNLSEPYIDPKYIDPILSYMLYYTTSRLRRNEGKGVSKRAAGTYCESNSAREMPDNVHG